MEMTRIVFKQIIGCKICTTAKPPIGKVSLFVIQFKISPVCMNGGYVWIQGVDDQRKATGKPFASFYFELSPHELSYFSMHQGCVDTAFFKDIAVFDYSGVASATTGSFPFI